MKLTKLYEGFNLGRPTDLVKRNEMLGIVDEIDKIRANMHNCRISVLRRFLNDNFLETLLSITIDLPEEQKHDYMRSLLETLGEQLADLPDGPISHDLCDHLGLLRSSVVEFCKKYTRSRYGPQI